MISAASKLVHPLTQVAKSPTMQKLVAQGATLGYKAANLAGFVSPNVIAERTPDLYKAFKIPETKFGRDIRQHQSFKNLINTLQNQFQGEKINVTYNEDTKRTTITVANIQIHLCDCPKDVLESFFTLRGDSRDPKEIFPNGFTARGIE